MYLACKAIQDAAETGVDCQEKVGDALKSQEKSLIIYLLMKNEIGCTKLVKLWSRGEKKSNYEVLVHRIFSQLLLPPQGTEKQGQRWESNRHYPCR